MASPQDQPLLRRHSDNGSVPVKAAPLTQFLKARGSLPARTWTSGQAELLRSLAGPEGAAFVDAVRSWYLTATKRLLADPKGEDTEGNFFLAWLRECHREIYDKIDTTDPVGLCKKRSLSGIQIPAIEHAFDELRNFDPELRTTTRRERALAKIAIDAYQILLVDLGAILATANVVAAADTGERVVVVSYLQHTMPISSSSIIKFWRDQGFCHTGLPRKGFVGLKDPRALQLPSYLHNFAELFPVAALSKHVNRAVQPERYREDENRDAIRDAIARRKGGIVRNCVCLFTRAAHSMPTQHWTRPNKNQKLLPCCVMIRDGSLRRPWLLLDGPGMPCAVLARYMSSFRTQKRPDMQKTTACQGVFVSKMKMYTEQEQHKTCLHHPVAATACARTPLQSFFTESRIITVHALKFLFLQYC